MYSNEARGGKFPPIPTFGYNHTLNGPALYPEYLTDIKVVVCPSDASASAGEVSEFLETIAAGDPNGEWSDVADFSDPVMRQFGIDWITSQHYSYCYLGWVVADNDSYYGYTAARVETRNAEVGSGGANQNKPVHGYDKDLTIPDTNNGPHGNYNGAFPDQPKVFMAGSAGGTSDTMYRVREGIERFFITDINNPAGSAQAQSSIPVYLDGFGGNYNASGNTTTGTQKKIAGRYNHVPGGSNILYMDGHVEFVKYPGKFPMTHFLSSYTMGGGDTADFKDGAKFLNITK